MLSANTVEGLKNGLFFYGPNGRQANPWGNSTSYVCVVPPRLRGGLLTGVGTTGACDGSFLSARTNDRREVGGFKPVQRFEHHLPAFMPDRQ